MQIGEIAKAANVSTDTIRFYERRGLIASQRRANGYRDFPAETVQAIEMIRKAQAMGFSLSEIREVILTMSENGLSAEQASKILTEKLVETEGRIREMQRMRMRLIDTIDQHCPLRTRLRRKDG